MDPQPWLELYDAWHDFFLLAGTGAVTLVGLLFVAISMHIDALVVAEREHLLVFARAILMSFVMVMTVSLMMLVPHQNPRLVGVELITAGVVGLAITAGQFRASGRQVHHGEFSRTVVRRRLLFPLFGYVWIAATGAAILRFRIPEFLFWLVGAVCMLLGNAAGSSWDLLVRVARLKRADAGKPEA